VPRVRQGCGCGCLTVILGGLLVLGGAWYGRGMLERSDASYEAGSPADGRRAQQKLFELSGKTASSRRDQKWVAVTLFEREINAFLVRHVSDELPLTEGAVHLVGNGIVEISGRLPIRAVLGDSIGSVARALPQRWAGQPVWLRLRGPLRLEAATARTGPRRLRVEVESLWVGSRRVPAVLLTILPEGPVLRATRWTVSGTIDTVVVEPGRLTVTSRP
jgi:hypothetical protein